MSVGLPSLLSFAKGFKHSLLGDHGPSLTTRLKASSLHGAHGALSQVAFNTPARLRQAGALEYRRSKNRCAWGVHDKRLRNAAGRSCPVTRPRPGAHPSPPGCAPRNPLSHALHLVWFSRGAQEQVWGRAVMAVNASICLVTFITTNLLQPKGPTAWGPSAVAINKAYADVHGYSYHLYQQALQPDDAPVNWSPPIAAEKLLQVRARRWIVTGGSCCCPRRRAGRWNHSFDGDVRRDRRIRSVSTCWR